MCNACGFQCCGSDQFERCGCNHCDNPACWEVCESCGEYEWECVCVEDDCDFDEDYA